MMPAVPRDAGRRGRCGPTWATSSGCATRRRDYTPLEQLGRQRLHPGGMLVLPQPVRAAGHRRGLALGAGLRGRRVRLRPAASLLDPAHRPGPDARGAQVRGRLALRAPLGSPRCRAGLDDAELQVALRAAPRAGHWRGPGQTLGRQPRPPPLLHVGRGHAHSVSFRTRRGLTFVPPRPDGSLPLDGTSGPGLHGLRQGAAGPRLRDSWSFPLGSWSGSSRTSRSSAPTGAPGGRSSSRRTSPCPS